MPSHTQPVYVLVVGQSGAGKSTFANLASNAGFAVGSGLRPTTTSLEESPPFEVEGQHVVLVDTPGLTGAVEDDIEVLSQIAIYLSSLVKQQAELAGVIYMHRITDTRVTGGDRRSINSLKSLCGPDALGNISVTTSMWDQVDPSKGEEREQELSNAEDFFKPILEAGGTIQRHYGTADSAASIMRSVSKKGQVVLRVQNEMAEKKAFFGTTVGMELLAELGVVGLSDKLSGGGSLGKEEVYADFEVLSSSEGGEVVGEEDFVERSRAAVLREHEEEVEEMKRQMQQAKLLLQEQWEVLEQQNKGRWKGPSTYLRELRDGIWWIVDWTTQSWGHPRGVDNSPDRHI